MLVAGAEDDGVNLLGGTILEMGRLVDQLLQQRAFFEVRRPFEAHGFGAVSGGHRARAIFPALGADVFGGIAAAHDQNVLALEFQGIAEIMGVHDATIEGGDALEEGNLRSGEVAGGYDHMIKFLGIHLVLHAVMDGDLKFFLFLVACPPCARAN